MNNNISYRKAEPFDALRLSVLFMQVYIQTYADEGVSTEFANFMSKQFSVTRIQNTIAANADCIVVATFKDNLIGVAEIEYNKLCPVNNTVGPELSKLYVLEKFCGMGVGHGLLHEVEKILALKQLNYLWLQVYLLNTRAIAFYKRQGYQWIGNVLFEMEVNTYENKIMHKYL